VDGPGWTPENLAGKQAEDSILATTTTTTTTTTTMETLAEAAQLVTLALTHGQN